MYYRDRKEHFGVTMPQNVKTVLPWIGGGVAIVLIAVLLYRMREASTVKTMRAPEGIRLY